MSPTDDDPLSTDDAGGVEQARQAIDPSRAQAFERLYRAHLPAVLAFSLRRAANRADAEEVAAEVFLVAWRRWEQIPDGYELPWLLRTALLTLSTARRAQRRRNRLVERIGALTRESAVPDPADRFAEDPQLGTAFARLSGSDQEVLRLVAWDDLSHAQAAMVLDVSENAVALRVSRARARLDRHLRSLTGGSRSGHLRGDRTRPEEEHDA